MVFDEPTNGAECPVGIAETRQLILDLSREGKTILLASHLLDEVEKVCSHVAILQKGQLLMAGNVNEVLTDEDFVELGAPDMQKLASILSGLPGVRQIKPFEQTLQVYFDQARTDLDDINRYCFEKGVVLNHLQLRKRSLESKFMELTNKITPCGEFFRCKNGWKVQEPIIELSGSCWPLRSSVFPGSTICSMTIFDNKFPKMHGKSIFGSPLSPSRTSGRP